MRQKALLCGATVFLSHVLSRSKQVLVLEFVRTCHACVPYACVRACVWLLLGAWFVYV